MFTVTNNQLKTVAYAMSTEETRYYLNGIYVEASPFENVILTAADGHRLANITLDTKSKEEWKGIIPANTVKEMIKSKKDFIIEKDIVVSTDFQISIKYTPVDGTFPDYRRVMPSNLTKEIQFNKKYLIDLLKSLPDKSVTFSISDNFSPALITSDIAGNAVHVLMPQRL